VTVQHLLREHSVDDSFIDEAQYSHVAYTEWMDGLTYKALTLLPWPRAGSEAVSKWVICACDSLVDFGTV